jgi:hypothetical protein
MLTLEELREHIGDGPTDDVLERLLDAAVESIDARIGTEAETTNELLRPSGSLVALSRRATAVSSVIEAEVALDAADYELRSGGRLLQRVNADGDRVAWSGWVEVTYTHYSDEAERNRVAIGLVKLDLNNNPGLTGTTIGSWSEQYYQGDRSYSVEREALLKSLRQQTAGVW